MWQSRDSGFMFAVASAEFWGMSLYPARTRRAQGVRKAARVYRPTAACLHAPPYAIWDQLPGWSVRV